jgi:transcriptional regulator with XRE-family HTH domain
MQIHDPIDLGRIIHTRRRTMGWSQARLAKAARVGRQWLLELEKGKKGPPLDLVINVLDALGCTLDVTIDMLADLRIGSELARLRAETHSSTQSHGAGRRNEQEVTPDLRALEGSSLVEGPRNRPESKTQASHIYRVTNFETLEMTANPGQLYVLENRISLVRMVAHAISLEAPIFEDLLARRVARAHGLARATRKLVEIIQEITEGKYGRTREDDRTVVWPKKGEIGQLTPFRAAPLDLRDHVDIPLEELASLAIPLLAEGHAPEAAAIIMARQLGLGRIMPNARSRLTAAAELARERLSAGEGVL